ncbi:helix-turn-helix domain-containing protein [Nocardia farcinica]|uniref:helix-turn-helix domain-containing protein n=1 Tax=Nocardia farcinica TaxID=37329 RepID=UPI0024552FA1|nr:helix-turn-helix transcriptional regulator [Nocardia farcinica]
MDLNSTPEYASVFDAITDTPAQAENLRVRALLMHAIGERIDEFGWSQRVAANNLGVTQPRISDLKNGKLSRFSVDVLVNLATRVGLTVQVNVVATDEHANGREYACN